MSNCSSRALTLLSSVFGACGLLLVGIAVSTDYWLYMEEGIVLQQNQTTEIKMALHAGLWRVCFFAGREKGRCVASEYFLEPEINLVTENTENILKTVRTATPFPMVSLFLVFTAFVISNIGHIRPQRTILAFVSGIFFILSGLSNIIGVIVYISANTGDPGTKRDDEKKSHYSYGWSFYFGGLSFILAEMIGVLAVNIYIEKNREAHCKSRTELLKNPSSSSNAILRLPSYRFRYRRRSRSSSRSTEPSQSRDASPVGLKGFPSTDISMYTLSRDPSKANVSSLYGAEREGAGGGFLQLHNTFPKDPGVTVTVTGPGAAGATGTLGKDASSNTNTLNRKTTPV
ncbi:voltage-dependent calcium channel gamma-7 subunit-like isoform X2 [Chelonoidis abingdonii]|uniref:voltage-dependent calcium channel gamma-7 subunit-like isoform X2 n=1 Tax=Chelonoidis abingdonii TaxID=106734 RepID=UPI0013F1B4D3|nr:voltage-dependent calcium channel gamma-7 subunit-like [Chelonoidis abingdonii]